MLKKKNIIIVLITLFFIMFIKSSVFAATLSEVKYSNSKITVSGTCNTSNQIQVIIFDSNNEPMYLATVDVKDNSFNKVLDADFNLENGKSYSVKISDYDGIGTATSTFVATQTNGNTAITSNAIQNGVKDDTPKTGKNMKFYTVIAIVVLISMIWLLLKIY